MNWVRNAYLPSAVEAEVLSVVMQQKIAKYTQQLAEQPLVNRDAITRHFHFLPQKTLWTHGSLEVYFATL
jgi:hypothetical protein